MSVAVIARVWFVSIARSRLRPSLPIAVETVAPTENDGNVTEVWAELNVPGRQPRQSDRERKDRVYQANVEAHEGGCRELRTDQDLRSGVY
jgi:hypothetical protein